MPGAIVFEKAIAEDLDIGIGEVDVTNPGGGTIRGTRINLQSLAAGYEYAGAWTPGSLAVFPFGTLTTDIPIPGVALGDFVLVTFDSTVTSEQVLFNGYVAVAGTVRVALRNLGNVILNLGTGTLRVLVFKTNL